MSNANSSNVHSTSGNITIAVNVTNIYFIILDWFHLAASGTGIQTLEDLKEDHVLLVCRRPGEMSPGAAQLANGLKPFSPGDEVWIAAWKRICFSICACFPWCVDV